jgi:hypothetical protein
VQVHSNKTTGAKIGGTDAYGAGRKPTDGDGSAPLLEQAKIIGIRPQSIPYVRPIASPFYMARDFKSNVVSFRLNNLLICALI